MRCANTSRDTAPKRWIGLLLPGLLFVSAAGITACGSKGTHTAAADQSPSVSEPAPPPPPTESATAEPPQQPAQATPPASAEARTPAALDELLAPVALYPDALLAQVLAASSNPQEVMDGGNWLLQNTNLQGQALQDAAKQAGFGPPMQALVMFPTVVDMMCQNFDWTKQLGSAFDTDQSAVMASVQRLRAQAASVGNLKSNPQQKVETQTVDKQQVIVIQPTDPKVIYVPTYNPQVVYVTPPPPTPVVGPSTGDVIAAGLIGFTAGVIVGSMFSNNNYYPYPNWGYGGVWYGGNPYRRNVYVYAPNYNRGYPPGYRPGYGYRPPVNYPNRWNRASTLPAYNSSNYYNRFNGNQNLRPGNSPPPLVSNNVSNRPGAYRPNNSGNSTTVGRGNASNSGNITVNNNFNNNRSGGNAGTAGSGRPSGPAPGAGTASPAWKGQQQYQGARPGSARPATPAAGATNPAARPANPAARPANPSTRPGTSNGRPGADRGFGGAPTGAQPTRGGAAPARPSNSAAGPANRANGAGRETAFTGSSTRGGGAAAQQDRAAMNRGQASVGKGGTRPTSNNQQRGGRK